MAYLPLSTANLPDPAIDPAQGSSPADYFNTVLWSGDGTSTRSITGVGHQPDMLWIKNRSSSSYNHHLVDAVRGVSNRLVPNGTQAEAPSYVNSFEADGFELNSDTTVNGSGNSYVGWNWKANGSGVSNNVGTIPSQVSANTESGFSIITYTGNGTAGATVGHGLNSAPEMIIIKARNDTDSWPVYHVGNTYSGSPENSQLNLNSTTDGSGGATPAIWWNSTAPTSSVFSLGTNGGLNQSTELYVSYVFHSVEGFSKFGSYTGNGNADGTFVYTGFRPAFVMIKRTDSSDRWFMGDSTRSPTNTSDGIRLLDASGIDAEFANSPAEDYDMLSNGFKINTSDNGINASGGTYIYMAFAENPFKYSNAR